MYTRLLPVPVQSILLLGARGTGKSTWIRNHFSKAVHYDLLKTDEMLRLARTPSLLRNETEHLPENTWIVIDEVQKVPALLDEVQHLIEEKKLKFILSGSSSRKLKRNGVNLLAGRARVTQMFPLVSKEVGFDINISEVLKYGTLPISFTSDDPVSFLTSYVQTYLNEEIKAEALTRNLGGFSRFLEIAARQNGQVTNVSSIARDSGVQRTTVQGYFEILLDTLMGFWLPAWELKASTKQVSHPKFYFFDSGVARTLSGRVMYPPLPEEQGFLLETYLIHELRAYLSYQRLNYPIYFWRSHGNVECDIFLETQDGFVGIEVKSSAHWESKFSRGLLAIKDKLKQKFTGYGVFLGPRILSKNDFKVFPLKSFLEKLWSNDLIG